MPRKSADPAVAILDFFRTAPIDVAETVFALVYDTVKRRRPTSSRPVVGAAKPGRKPRATTPPVAPDVKELGS